MEFEFESVDFVAEPGQFAIRGGIVDVFSFSNDHPYRIEFFGDTVESIRTFDPVSQLSIQHMNRISLLPNVQDRKIEEKRVSILDYMPPKTICWIYDISYTSERIDKEFKKATETYNRFGKELQQATPDTLFTHGDQFLNQLENFKTIEFGHANYYKTGHAVQFNQRPQPAFNKKFELLINDLVEKSGKGYTNYILSDNAKQTERLYVIFEDIQKDHPESGKAHFTSLTMSLSAGFIDHDVKLICYTDHQIFERYHKFHLT